MIDADTTDEEIRRIFEYTSPIVKGSKMYEDAIAKAMAFRDQCIELRDNPRYPRHEPVPHPCSCCECIEHGLFVDEKPEWMGR